MPRGRAPTGSSCASWSATGGARPRRFAGPGVATARAIDLGCGAGSVSIELAEAGFDVTGVDFSPVALRKARAAASASGFDADRLRFLEGDLTLGHVPGVEGPYDLLVDYGTLDDLPTDGRRAMAAYAARLARPGSRLFLFAFYGDPADLPRMSFGGPSRAFPGLVPGEVERLFGARFTVEAIDPPTRTRHWGTWLLERTEAVDA